MMPSPDNDQVKFVRVIYFFGVDHVRAIKYQGIPVVEVSSSSLDTAACPWTGFRRTVFPGEYDKIG
jgi:hypothetical protein